MFYGWRQSSGAMLKSIPQKARAGLALPAFAFMAALASSQGAYSIMLSAGGIDYEIQAVFGTWDENKDRIMASPWFGNEPLASSLAGSHALAVQDVPTPKYVYGYNPNNQFGTEVFINQGLYDAFGGLRVFHLDEFSSFRPPAEGWAVQAPDEGPTALLALLGLGGLAAGRRLRRR